MNSYLLTAAGWASSPDPVEFAQAANNIHKMTTKLPTADLQALCDELLYHKDQNESLHACAFNAFLHVVRKRWGRLSDVDKDSWVSWSSHLILDASKSTWRVQNLTVKILVELIGKEGIQVWKKVVDATMFHLSSLNQATDEIAVERGMIQCLLDGVVIPEDSLKANRSNTLKNQNWSALSNILLCLLDNYMEDSKQLNAAGKESASQQHLQFAVDIVHTASTYAQWAHVRDLVEYADGFNWIIRCKTLIAYQHFRPVVFELLSEICSRIQPADCDHHTMRDVFKLLMIMSEDPLAQPNPIPGDTCMKHAERCCELMTALGLSSFGCIVVDDQLTFDFLKKMMEYYKDVATSCHDHALLFWEKMLYEDEKKGLRQHITDDMCVTCFCVAVGRFIQVVGTLSYREKLLSLIKVISSQKPLVATSYIMNGILPVYDNQQNLEAISAAKVALETVVSAIYCGSGDFSQPTAQALAELKDLAKEILDSRWTEPKCVGINCGLLHCFDRYLSHFPEMVITILDKLFEVLRSVPIDQDPSHVEARKMVRLSVISIKQAVGLDFEVYREEAISSLDGTKENSYITSLEYDQLWEELCDHVMTE